MTLITKIQYRNYEPGEFSDSKARTYEDTILLIENFPWQQQREHLIVSPTGPSITIESGLGEYLKLALYYEGKFVLYYLDATGHLYTKSFPAYRESFPWIQSFFEQRFTTDDLKLEQHWPHGKLIHFRDMDFSYSPKILGILTSIALFAVLCLFLLTSTFGLLLTTVLPKPQIYIVPPIFFLLLSLLLVRMALFINYYLVARDRSLVLSRGNDIFYYGPAGNLQRFDKKDIREIVVYGSGSRRLEIDGFIRIEMQSVTTPCIYIPYMVLHKGPLLSKLAGYPQREKFSFFPFIPLSSPVPS